MMMKSKIQYGYFILLVLLMQGCSITEDPRDKLLRTAIDLEYEKKFAEAEKVYKKVETVNTGPDLMQLSILLNEARFYLRTKNYAQAIAISKKGLQICPMVCGTTDMLNCSFLFVLASAYDNLEDYDNAIATYKQIIAFGPYSPCSKDLVTLLPVIKLGDIEFKEGHQQNALMYYKEAYELGKLSDAMMRVISYRLALCNISLKRYSAADSQFNIALPHKAHDSAPKDIYIQYAKFLAMYGKMASAGRALSQSPVWYAKHKEYVDWYNLRTNPGSRCRLIDIYTVSDYELVEAIQKNLIPVDVPHLMMRSKYAKKAKSS